MCPHAPLCMLSNVRASYRGQFSSVQFSSVQVLAPNLHGMERPSARGFDTKGVKQRILSYHVTPVTQFDTKGGSVCSLRHCAVPGSASVAQAGGVPSRAVRVWLKLGVGGVVQSRLLDKGLFMLVMTNDK